MNADVLHQDMYAYDIYAEYLNKIEHYSINSTINSLSIRYYKQNFPNTKGIRDEIDVVVNSGYDRAYDIFDFTPVLESQPLNYTNDMDETGQGLVRRTQGTMTIMAVVEPLPGDIFNFYQHGSTNEYFKVLDVNFVHSVKDLNIYQINFETAQWKRTTIDSLTIINHFYFVKEFRKFYDSSLYEGYATLIETRNDELALINAKYDCIGTKYTDTLTLSDGSTIPLPDEKINLLNSILLYLNEKVSLNIKYVSGYTILRDVNDLVIPITEQDTYVDDPTNPGVPIQSTVMEKVRNLQDIYFSFINYTSPLDGSVTNTSTTQPAPTFEEDAVATIVRDLDGNAIY